MQSTRAISEDEAQNALASNIRRLQEGLPFIRSIISLNASSLSRMLGISRQAMSALETGKNRMSTAQYIAIRSIISHQIARGVIGDWDGSITMYFLISGYIDGSIAEANPGGNVLDLLKIFTALSPADTPEKAKRLRSTAENFGINIPDSFRSVAEDADLPEPAAFLKWLMEWMDELPQ